MKKHNFNMIEILLALGLTAIGITGLMGIIPLALNANRDAMAETYTADIANSFFAQRSAIAAKNFSTITSFYNSKPGGIAVWFPTNLSSNPATAPVDLTADMELTPGDQSGVYHVRVGKEGTSLPDFSADLCVWYEYPNDVTDYDNSSNHKLARLYLEISWPVTASYANREKQTYVKEFLDSNIPLKEE